MIFYTLYLQVESKLFVLIQTLQRGGERLSDIFFPNRSIQNPDNPLLVSDFTDRSYQETLPGFARATASKSIKNNIANSELLMNPDTIYSVEKAQKIMQQHIEDKRRDKLKSPSRYSISKKSKYHPSSVSGPYSLYTGPCAYNNEEVFIDEEADNGAGDTELMNFKEVSVKQLEHLSERNSNR